MHLPTLFENNPVPILNKIDSIWAENRADLDTEPATKNSSYATGVMFNLGEVMRYKSKQ